MAFKFGLNTVLKHRQRLEDVAQREYAEAQAAVDECLRAIEAMYQRNDEVRDDIAAAQKKGSAESVHQIRDMETFLGGQKIRIEHMRLKARELLVIAEIKQEALIEAAKEKKVLVKLKEKRFAEYKEWLARMETKEMDDMTSMRSARRKA